MKIYIACPYPERPYALVVRRFCLSQGWECCARWLDPSHDNLPAFQTIDLQRVDALEDISDVAQCDVFIALNPDGYANTGSGGRHVELGIAITLDKRIILIGDHSNIFHRLPSVKHIGLSTSTSQLIAAILGQQ